MDEVTDTNVTERPMCGLRVHIDEDVDKYLNVLLSTRTKNS